ncbi:glutamate racemase [Lachnospiraceae bacterium KM106-2]|nr:glutamate racemase [Lachnospiraceae bacterium KM106-2]
MKIGFFDSGIGGISVLHQARKLLPGEDYIFYADVDHVPYGVKTKEEVISYVDEALSFMKDHGAKAVVVACNTATSVAIAKMREKYDMPLIGMEPAVKPAVEESESKHDRVLVIATPLTVKEDKLKNLLMRVDENHQVDLLPLPKLVSFAEKGEFTSPEVEEYLRNEFSRFSLEEYSSMVLGCTHFNYFKDTFHKLLPERMKYIDGCQGTIHHLKEILEEDGLLEQNEGTVEYYLSGRQVTGEKDLERFEQLYVRLDQMLQY